MCQLGEGSRYRSVCWQPSPCSSSLMWWRCLPATVKWLLWLHSSDCAKPEARDWSVSACAADNTASVTVRPKSVCREAKARDGFVTQHTVPFKHSGIGVGTLSSCAELCHVIYFAPLDVFSFSSWGVHNDYVWTSFPSKGSAAWHTVSFIPVEIFLHFVNKMRFPHRTVFFTKCFLFN